MPSCFRNRILREVTQSLRRSPLACINRLPRKTCHFPDSA